MAEGGRGTTRRAVVAGVLGLTGAAFLGGCSVRLERDAPDIPGLKTPDPPPDQPVLLATLADLRRLHTAAEATPGEGARLAAMHQAQADRLAAVVAGLGITAPTTTSPATPVLGSAEVAFAPGARVADIARASTTYVPMLAAVLASRGAAGQSLGQAPVWPAARMPSALAVSLLAAVRPAVYGFEMIAARTPSKERKPVRATLKQLYAARSSLEAAAGAAAPPAQLTYQLPFAITDASSRSRLAQELLTAMVTTAAGQAAGVRGRPADLSGLLDVWSTAIALSWTWGVAPTAFPGLTA
ncbi:DUF4439 domain-containing protein [Luteipulveratus mongoliensis]|uniref:DUF4439 domain-containing protein n=1 Tax=Luteipulveratus mongoliensis TaxID=571913 RepID=A0A0K1JIR2_9MICO|nr:DUF4439 domain-containing protein [Luteipulveratus mongoliensis]AKU16473.1 hypothetical protein VV02_12345 [Luteipulveratus mongoliensis]